MYLTLKLQIFRRWNISLEIEEFFNAQENGAAPNLSDKVIDWTETADQSNIVNRRWAETIVLSQRDKFQSANTCC